MTNEINASEVEIRWQETPNPFALKFVVNKSLKDEGKATFVSKEDSNGLPMVNSLLDVLGVKQVYIQGNSLTVSHDGQMETDNIVDTVKSILKTRMTIHDPAFRTAEESNEAKKPQEVDRSNLSKELVEIEEVLDRTIRPGLYADGGDVEVISFENDELRIMYQGACGGCPSAMMGTLDAIQNILRHELDNPNIIVIPI